MPELHPSGAEGRWEQESAYFDAQEYTTAPLPPEVTQRYRECRRPYLAAEYPYWSLGDVREKRILDVGCGDGANAILLAQKGANVVGIDLSAKAIAAAEKRAKLHNLSERVRFLCGPLETSLPGESRFDIVTGFAILHHLLPVLPEFLQELKRHGTAETQFLFVEPVNLWPGLRQLRLALPIAVSGTPDERPLEQKELDLVRYNFSRVEMKVFHGLARFADRFLLRGRGYERAAWWRRLAYRWACRIDRILFDRLRLEKLGSVAVITAFP